MVFQLYNDIDILDNLDHVLYFFLDESVNLMYEYFLFHLEVKESADFSLNQKKANKNREKLDELKLLFASLILLN